jgi:hypothetical protein
MPKENPDVGVSFARIPLQDLDIDIFKLKCLSDK